MKKLFFTLALTLVAFTGNAQVYTYDVNNDGFINVTDVTCLVNKILGIANPDEIPESHLTCPDENHPHLIDLGLPSGTKWACCNVGANKPEAYGGYYAWGETVEKEVYNDVTYEYSTGVDTDGDGFYDKDIQYQDLGSDIAGTDYDVAHVLWGGAWTMASFDQIKELLNCTNEWTTINGVEGMKFTGNNGGSIFMPASGFYKGSYIDRVNKNGYYWSSTQDSSSASEAYEQIIGPVGTSWNNDLPYYGQSVRPVVRNKSNLSQQE